MQGLPKTPGFYRFMAGDIEVICINDGILSGDINAVRGVSIEQVRALFDESFFPSEVRCTTNNYIIRSQGHTALVDTGGGSFIIDTAGKMLENAAAAGISPSDIDTILFTHIHPDHISGLMDANWKKIFPQAVLKMHAAEFEFWLSEDPPSRKIAHVKHEADHVIRFMTPYFDQIERFERGEVFPGVNAVALPGHTPGHTGYLISSQGEEILIWGDIIHWPVVQFALPDAAMSYDVDPVKATATRWDILNKVASSGLLVAGMHLYFPGFTRVRREGNAFAMAPVPWGHATYAERGTSS
ncbi:MAG: MBL fold metallo-hydrolase [Bacteroidetes bacterium]|nr:MBL fold metallo-hydrolase [Bacteroidota bacterium]